jgi:hypothetical protein
MDAAERKEDIRWEEVGYMSQVEIINKYIRQRAKSAAALVSGAD